MLLSELKLTVKQKNLLRDIVQSHPYFPELALDDLTFNNNFYKPKDPTIQDMVDKEVIIKGPGKSLILTRRAAKHLWEEILSTIPVDQAYSPTSVAFLMTRDIEVLRKAYTTLTSKPADGLDKETLVNEIHNSYINQGEKMTETKKTVKSSNTKAKEAPAKKAKAAPVDDGKLTPKQIASQYKISPTEVRKALRSFYKGKCTDGNWRISPEEVEEIMEAYQAKKAAASKARSERMKAMIEERKAKKEASAEKPAKAVKKSAVKAKPAKKVEAEVEEDEDDEE